jgi:hypothetical protein
MSKGFSHLEKEGIDKARSVLRKYFKDYPKNKTARLCYARAIGLNKQSEKHWIFFIDLKRIPR